MNRGILIFTLCLLAASAAYGKDAGRKVTRRDPEVGNTIVSTNPDTNQEDVKVAKPHIPSKNGKIASLRSLKPLGEFKGVSYYMDDNATMAYEYCQSQNMSLVAVRNQEDKDFIENAFREQDFSAHYEDGRILVSMWLAGIDSSRSYMPEWVPEGVLLDMLVFVNWDSPPEWATPGSYCGQYDVWLTGEDGRVSTIRVHGNSCDFPLQGVLCSKIN